MSAANQEFGDDFIRKLTMFNDFYEVTPNLQMNYKSNGDELLLEGQLRIHWGILYPILFKEKDEEVPAMTSSYQRHSCGPVTTPDSEFLLNFDNADAKLWNGLPGKDEGKSQFGSVVLRNNRKRKRTRKRLSIINGHTYSTETSLFKPDRGSVTGVMVTSQQTTQEVIQVLLNKFKVENYPMEFCLCVVRNNGEMYALKDQAYPLLERVLLGPREDEVKIFIMEKHWIVDINEEVAQFINLPEAVLFGFLDKYKKDEESEKEIIQEKYRIYREKLEERLEMLSPSS